MPTYDYKCSKCEYCFDKILSISERKTPETEPCPKCSEQNSVEILIGVPSLVSPFRIDGLKKPQSQFKDRMQQIKAGLGKKHNLKDHY
jgi:putative FmdB family regulatory protein